MISRPEESRKPDVSLDELDRLKRLASPGIGGVVARATLKLPHFRDRERRRLDAAIEDLEEDRHEGETVTYANGDTLTWKQAKFAGLRIETEND